MRGARLEDCRDVDIGYQSKLSHRARSERGDEWKPTLNAKSSLKAILALVRQHQRYDVEFSKRYYGMYFEGHKIVKEEEVFAGVLDSEIVGVI